MQIHLRDSLYQRAAIVQVQDPHRTATGGEREQRAGNEANEVTDTNDKGGSTRWTAHALGCGGAYRLCKARVSDYQKAGKAQDSQYSP